MYPSRQAAKLAGMQRLLRRCRARYPDCILWRVPGDIPVPRGVCKCVCVCMCVCVFVCCSVALFAVCFNKLYPVDIYQTPAPRGPKRGGVFANGSKSYFPFPRTRPTGHFSPSLFPTPRLSLSNKVVFVCLVRLVAESCLIIFNDPR